MNLQSFLNYKNICPLCSNPLKLFFHHKSAQLIDNNNILIKFNMYSAKRHTKTCQVGFYINLVDNSFHIEFYTKDDEKLENIPMLLLKHFKEYNLNLSQYQFYNICKHCNNYECESNYFDINLNNLSNLNIGDLIISKETFCMYDKCQDGYLRFRLVNDFESNKSFLKICETNTNNPRNISDLVTVKNHNIYEIDLINFSSKEAMINKFNKLLPFL